MDQKHPNKLSCVADVQSNTEPREITKRFDLDPGYYIIMPYHLNPSHTGKFLIRLLSEKDQIANKTGW